MWYSAVGYIVTLVLLLCWAPLAVHAQQPAKVPRIGYLRPDGVSPCRNDLFAQGLRELGYVEGHTIVIEWRCADGMPERARELAVELVQLPVDVFVAGAADGPLAAMQATRTIPIVFVNVIDPVAMGLVANLARPGGNVTGVASYVGLEVNAKRLQLLMEAVPGVTRVAALQHGTFVRALPARQHMQQAVEEAARSLGIHLQMVEVDAADELEGAFAAMMREGAEALFMFTSPFFNTHNKRIVELAAQHRLPAVYEFRAQVVAGGLMSYNASYAEYIRRAASYVDRILKGAKPADLPVEQPMKFELVINLKTAKELDLTIPPLAPLPSGRGHQIGRRRSALEGCGTDIWEHTMGLASRVGDIPSRTPACSRQGKPETLELGESPRNWLLLPSGCEPYGSSPT
jgi:putative ABC transport system substrate-binding protein